MLIMDWWLSYLVRLSLIKLLVSSAYYAYSIDMTLHNEHKVDKTIIIYSYSKMGKYRASYNITIILYSLSSKNFKKDNHRKKN